MLLKLIAVAAGLVFLFLMVTLVRDYIITYNERINQTVRRMGYSDLNQMEKANKKTRSFSEIFFGEPEIPLPEGRAVRKKPSGKKSSSKKGEKRRKKTSSSAKRPQRKSSGRQKSSRRNAGRASSGPRTRSKRNITKPSNRGRNSRNTKGRRKQK